MATIQNGQSQSYSLDDDDDDIDDIEDLDDVNEAIEEVHSSLAEAVEDEYSKKEVAKGCSILCKLYLKRHDFNSALNKNDEAKKDLQVALYLASPKQLVYLKGMGVDTNIDSDKLDDFGIEEYNAEHYAVAAYLFEKSMEMGNMFAEAHLGDCYYVGNGVPEDNDKAFELFQKSAARGNALAMRSLGRFYKEVDNNYAKAKEWYNKAKSYGKKNMEELLEELDEKFPDEKKKIDDALEKALEHWEAGEYKEAMSVWESLGNEPRALDQLGDCYFHNKGNVGEDNDKAFKYFLPSAEQGFAKSQLSLGVCYENGYGVSKDKYKAVEWYRKAAEQGHFLAQRYLGNSYYNGDVVSRDYNKAFEWYSKAAEQGDGAAQTNLGYCYQEGHGVSKNIYKAVEWYSKAAEQGESFGQNNLGVCYRDGTGVKKNYKKAEEWLKKAVEQGNDAAKDNLKKLRKLKGKIVEKLVGVGIVVGIIGITVLINLDSIRSTASSVSNEVKSMTQPASVAPITYYVIPSDWQNGTDKNIAKNTKFFAKVETIDNQQKNVLTVMANLPSGGKWSAAQVVLERTKATIISRIRQASGVRFKVLGDGKTWRITFPIKETEKDWCVHEYVIRTEKNKVMEINVPYTSLKQQSWGKQVPFNKNDITSVVLQANTDYATGSTTIKVFDFGVW